MACTGYTRRRSGTRVPGTTGRGAEWPRSLCRCLCCESRCATTARRLHPFAAGSRRRLRAGANTGAMHGSNTAADGATGIAVRHLRPRRYRSTSVDTPAITIPMGHGSRRFSSATTTISPATPPSGNTSRSARCNGQRRRRSHSGACRRRGVPCSRTSSTPGPASRHRSTLRRSHTRNRRNGGAKNCRAEALTTRSLASGERPTRVRCGNHSRDLPRVNDRHQARAGQTAPAGKTSSTGEVPHRSPCMAAGRPGNTTEANNEEVRSAIDREPGPMRPHPDGRPLPANS